ncbi:hypothetical protein RB195_016005 [Necator americanus]|uniref:ShKT domain-containing protein n=1 Tax=Necator americanus TaxID=51031 RepID=A0ABR1E7A7_NECAM
MSTALAVLLFVFFIEGTQSQYVLTCGNGGVGICIAGGCSSPTQLCITTVSGPMCCEVSQIVYTVGPAAPVVAPQVVAPTATCFDRVDPRTGVSDCPSKAFLCNNPLYQQLMTEQCPLTCNKCTGTGTTTCRDFVDPRTGVSNCPLLVAYCRDALYAQLMREQCPRTCGYCV